MSNPFRPGADSVRLAYVDRQGFLAQFARTGRKEDAAYEAEFDLWLAKVKADARREGLADGWDEGHDAATDEAPDGVWPDAWIDTPNPYRNGAGR